MGNARYRAGRAFEYKVANELREEGWKVIRAAGSHGPFDLVAWSPEVGVRLIQCKIVQKMSDAVRLETAWHEEFAPCPFYKQELIMWVKEDRLTVIAEIGG